MCNARNYKIVPLLAAGVAFTLALVTTLYHSGLHSVDFFCYLVLLVLCGSLFVSLKAMAVIVIAVSAGLLVLPILTPPVSGGNVSPGYFVIVSGAILLATYYRNWLERDWRAKLAESERPYRGLFHHSNDGIFLHDLEGHIVDVNQRALEQFGSTAPEMLARKIFDLVPPEALGAFRTALEKIGQNGVVRFETDFKKDDSLFPAEVSSSLLEMGGKQVIQSTVRDITERVQMASRLARRNRELELLNSAGQALSASLDLDQVLTTVLEEIRHLLGAVASSVWLIEPQPESQEEASHVGALVCQQASGPQSEVVIGWQLAPGQGLVGHVARSGESLIVSDVRDDERHFKGVDERTGLALRSILSVPLQAKGEVIGVLQVVDEAMNSLKPADLALVESLAATAAIAIENARLFAQEEQRAAELARALGQQQELDRLKDEFIQNVSHELRTPLTIARGYAELLNCGKLGTLKPKQQEALAIITRHTHVLSELVNDIVTFLDVERQMLREPVDMVSLVQDALADWQTRIAVGEIELTLTTQVAPDLPLVLGAPLQLKRVLDNLLGNAYKFTPAGGRVAVQLKKNGTGVVLEVTDTGIGIPPDQLEQVFGRFYQVDGGTTRRYGGTGLGLALVKEIVEAHGGRVTVQSAVGEGSTFRVTLPARSGEEQC